MKPMKYVSAETRFFYSADDSAEEIGEEEAISQRQPTGLVAIP